MSAARLDSALSRWAGKRRGIMASLRLVGVWVATLLLTSAIAVPARAQTEVDVKLVLLADASGSIDGTELSLQRQGYASALAHPEVLRAIAQGLRRRIAIVYVEWGNDQWQDVVVPWTVIDGPASARAFGAALLEQPRRAHGGNAIGSAIAKGQSLIDGPEFRAGAQRHRPLRRQRQQLERHPDPAGARRGAGARHRHQRPRHPLPREPLQRPAHVL